MSLRAGIVLLVIAVMGCSGEGSDGTSSSVPVPPSSTVTSATSTSTTTSSPTTSTSMPVCDPAVAIDSLDHATEAGRLESIDDLWTTDTSGSLYAETVVDPEQFAASLGFDCSLRVVQGVGTQFERLGLVAWTDDRMGYVVLAIDQPTTPFEEAVRFDLLFEQPWGEWVTDELWAVTVSSGDTVMVGAEDFIHGAVAKSFLVAFPEPPSPPAELPAEDYAMGALEAVDMRNIGIAEPSDTEVGSIVFTTPLGNPMVAVVGPAEVFDPFSGYLTGDATVTVVEGVDVTTTLPGPDQYGVADVAFLCGDYGWRIESSLGSPDEPLAVAGALIVSLSCPS